MADAGAWVEVADRVWARRYAGLDLTLGLVVGDDACLVIDTGGDEVQGAEFATAIRTLTDLPWSVVLTHAHFDHVFGTAAFDDRPVWAHRGCHADLVNTGEQQRAAWVSQYRENGRTELADRLATARLVLPDHLVDEQAELDLGGGRVVRLVHPGPAHSDHDLAVHVPDVDVLFAGDMVEHGAPPSFNDSHPLSWPTAVDRLMTLEPRTVVPGHGDPVDRAFVTTQRAELATVADLSRSVRDGEIDRAEALARSPYPEVFTSAAIDRVTG